MWYIGRLISISNHYTPATKLVGYIGISLSVRLSIRLSVQITLCAQLLLNRWADFFMCRPGCLIFIMTLTMTLLWGYLVSFVDSSTNGEKKPMHNSYVFR